MTDIELETFHALPLPQARPKLPHFARLFSAFDHYSSNPLIMGLVASDESCLEAVLTEVDNCCKYVVYFIYFLPSRIFPFCFLR